MPAKRSNLYLFPLDYTQPSHLLTGNCVEGSMLEFPPWSPVARLPASYPLRRLPCYLIFPLSGRHLGQRPLGEYV